jgi:hypothetical protein
MLLKQGKYLIIASKLLNAFAIEQGTHNKKMKRTVDKESKYLPEAKNGRAGGEEDQTKKICEVFEAGIRGRPVSILEAHKFKQYPSRRQKKKFKSQSAKCNLP